MDTLWHRKEAASGQDLDGRERDKPKESRLTRAGQGVVVTCRYPAMGGSEWRWGGELGPGQQDRRPRPEREMQQPMDGLDEWQVDRQ